MDQKSLKTSPAQRIIIIIIALLLLGSTVLTYIFVVLNSNSNSNSTEARIAELTAEFDEKNAELDAVTKPLSDKYFETFKSFRSDVKAYNETAANNAILEAKDLKEGTGRELTEDDTNYLAYYIGWCADGTVFQSSFDDYDDPTALGTPLDPANGLIEGWNKGIAGMKIGGVRQLTISGSLAYGDTQEICGGYNKPVKFIMMAIDPNSEVSNLSKELQNIYLQLYMAYYGAV